MKFPKLQPDPGSGNLTLLHTGSRDGRKGEWSSLLFALDLVSQYSLSSVFWTKKLLSKLSKTLISPGFWAMVNFRNEISWLLIQSSSPYFPYLPQCNTLENEILRINRKTFGKVTASVWNNKDTILIFLPEILQWWSLIVLICRQQKCAHQIEDKCLRAAAASQRSPLQHTAHTGPLGSTQQLFPVFVPKGLLWSILCIH
jgi:hypothetical protein